TWSSFLSSAITSSPTRSEGSSRSPLRRRPLITARTASSMSAAGTGRFCRARSKLVRSLRSSKASRRPSLLTMAGSFSSAVSKVLKRSPQLGHSRRRRMVLPSSLTRESITRVSSCWQNGQYMGVRAATASSSVDRELPALLDDVLTYAGEHPLVGRRVQHVADPVGQGHAVGLPVAAGGDGRGADAQAGGDEGRARVA